MAQFLVAATNTSMFTYEMAPVFSLMEGEVLGKMRGLIGWQSGDGIFAPGGSISNLYGLLLARFIKFPNVKDEGVRNLPQMVLFCSEQVIIMLYYAGFHSEILSAAITELRVGVTTKAVLKQRGN